VRCKIYPTRSSASSVGLSLLAFDGNETGVAQPWVGEHAAERGGAVCPQRERRDAQPVCRAQRRVALPVDHRARDVLATTEQRREGLPEGRLAGGVQGQELRDDVGGHGLVGERRLVDGDEGELRVARGVGGVEAGVEDRHGEAPRMEQRGELERRTDVALERQREQHDPPAAMLLSGHRDLPIERGCCNARSTDRDGICRNVCASMHTQCGHVTQPTEETHVLATTTRAR
jgi:hypothetical protein